MIPERVKVLPVSALISKLPAEVSRTEIFPVMAAVPLTIRMPLKFPCSLAMTVLLIVIPSASVSWVLLLRETAPVPRALL